ncbi:hypothetical protein BOTBODRAFT_291554 [Botryobasidium botryosum FD-172 SS1]|uniref:Uncharacterized protein n=1 Tax=Botryobasidium botryosum (strain FD-172 SS1) TaxID=930990 RepID=A0A067MU92_BOTB1|nr:hypothetical protein BOTBODRAFT_291554 [Botryobasidium botryosum FD-172 SS1]
MSLVAKGRGPWCQFSSGPDLERFSSRDHLPCGLPTSASDRSRVPTSIKTCCATTSQRVRKGTRRVFYARTNIHINGGGVWNYGRLVIMNRYRHTRILATGSGSFYVALFFSARRLQRDAVPCFCADVEKEKLSVMVANFHYVMILRLRVAAGNFGPECLT